jgi:hypothetical protein
MTLFVGVDSGQGVFASPDQGATWTNPLSGVSVIGIAQIGNTLYALTANGYLYQSTTNGVSWILNGSAPVPQTCWQLAATTNTLIAGTSSGVYVWNGSSAWTSAAATAGPIFYAVAASGINCLGANDVGQIWNAPDNGVTWNKVLDIGEYAGSGGIFLKEDIGITGFGLASIYYSATSGSTWQASLYGFSVPQQFCTDGTAYYLANYDDGVYKTTDLSTYSASSIGIVDIDVTSMCADVSNIYTGTTNGVLYSSAFGGALWTNPVTTINDVPATSFSGRIYSIFSIGVTNYTIAASSGPNGSISPTGSVTVASGSSQTFNFTPNATYQLATLTVDGSFTTPSGSYTFSNVAANHTIAVTYSLITYTITASSDSHGTISPTGSVTVTSGSAQTFNFTPNAGYQLSTLTVDGVSKSLSSSYTFSNVQSAHSIAVTYSLIPTYTIVASSDTNGSISPSGSVTVSSGSTQTFSFTPNTGFHLATLLVDSVPQALASSYTFSNIVAGHTISVSFSEAYYINVSATAGGTVLPAGNIVLSYGGSQTFSITPDYGYQLTNLTVNGTVQRLATSYTFTNVQTNQTVSVAFSKLGNALKSVSGTVVRDFRQNSDIVNAVIYSAGLSNSSAVPIGINMNKAAVQSQKFGLDQDIVLNIDGTYDVTPRWSYGVSPQQYVQNVALNRLTSYTQHHQSTCTHDDKINQTSVHILVVGDFQNTAPTPLQLSRLLSLIDYFTEFYTLKNVYYHSDIDPTSDPGRYFFSKSQLGVAAQKKINTVPVPFVTLVPQNIVPLQQGTT